jgi:hypothetical protein
MQDKVIYEWAIIRLVPVVERGECLNVGVIVYSKMKKYLGIKYHLDENRLKAFAGDIDIESLREYLHAWEKVCQGGVGGGTIGGLEMHLRFRWLTATRSTIIQSSKVHSGICNDPAQVLDDLFHTYVL